MLFVLAIGVAEDVATGNIEDNQIMLALISIIALSVSALVYVIKNGKVSRRTNRTVNETKIQATAANAAVNNVGPLEPRIYDLVESIKNHNKRLETVIADLKSDVSEIKKVQKEYAMHGWAMLPEDLNTAVNMALTIRAMQESDRQIKSQLDIIIKELRDMQTRAKATGTTNAGK